MPDGHNPILETIFSRVREPGDEIIAYIAYGIYKERKRAFLQRRQGELAGTVPPAEVDTFVRTYDDGQIDLVWSAAKDTLATFAVNYADAEKDEAVRDALKEALRGHFWKQVLVSAGAAAVLALGILALYLLAQRFGVDLVDQFQRLDEVFRREPTPSQ